MKNFQIAKKTPATATNNVELVNSMVAKATAFTTLQDAENSLARFTATDNATRYTIGSIFNAVKEKKLTDNVAEWAAKWGYASNTVYQLATIAKNFSYEEMEKWGMGKLIEMRNHTTLELMESKGVTPNNTAKDIRKVVSDSKETKKATSPRKESTKTTLKREKKYLEKLMEIVAVTDDKKWKDKNLPILDDRHTAEILEMMDKLNIAVGNALEVVNDNITTIELEELKKKQAKENKKLAKENKNNK